LTELVGRKLEAEDVQIFPHVLLGTRSGERNDAGLVEIPKEDLGFGLLVLPRQGSNDIAAENVRVRREGPETLIDDPMIGASAP
jgi:hypothetical protein